ncbi:FadR family transcriptional regulator, partial [Streptomyces sp. SID7499]|nr:FadR family transcriptional regulator [Streptomyces sp. SID7499]
EEALEQILQLLRLGLVPPGERLPSERELSQHLRISRVTLREVLKVLQDQGMVESRRGRYGGTFVLPRTAAPDDSDELRRRIATVDVEDTLRFREVLEAGAAGLCAEGLPADGGVRLRAALDATRGARLEDYRRQDTLLHL